ncbi:MAG: VOC family protein [Actinobacteria bacterium]|nr:VOC family protein [Actinomycetota bacterium]
MKISRLNHIGVLVADLDGAMTGFRDILGLELERTERYGDELDIAFLPCGETDVEIIVPRAEKGWNAEWLAEHGPAIQHAAFEVEDLVEALDEARARGARVIEPAPRPGAGGMEIAFLDPEQFGGVLIELCQRAG